MENYIANPNNFLCEQEHLKYLKYNSKFRNCYNTFSDGFNKLLYGDLFSWLILAGAKLVQT